MESISHSKYSKNIIDNYICSNPSQIEQKIISFLSKHNIIQVNIRAMINRKKPRKNTY